MEKKKKFLLCKTTKEIKEKQKKKQTRSIQLFAILRDKKISIWQRFLVTKCSKIHQTMM